MSYLKYAIALIVIAGFIYTGLAALDVYTPEAFSLLAAGVIAFAFERFPWLAEEFDKLTSSQKQLAMLAMLFLVVAGAFGLSCAAVVVAFACTGAGALQALMVLLVAIGVNQGVFGLAHVKQGG